MFDQRFLLNQVIQFGLASVGGSIN